MSMIVEENAAIHHNIGHAVGCILGLFIADDGFIGLHDPEWLQEALSVLIGLFIQIGLMANVAKSKMMTC